MIQHHTTRARSGYTLLEVTFSAAILSIMLLAMFGVLERQTQLGRSTLATAIAENRAIEITSALRRELVGARAKRVRCILTTSLNAGASGPGSLALVSTTTGFPPTGRLLFDADTADFERIGYQFLDADELQFGDLTRGLGSTGATAHTSSAAWVWWAGMATPIAGVPGPNDGTAWVNGAEVPFRGDGLGFSYRVPVDADGTGGMPDYLDGLEPAWGAITESGPAGSLAPNTSGWCVIVYEAREEISEASLGADLNSDGDQMDTFEIGRLRKFTWDTTDPAIPVHSQSLGAACILQERDAPAADLDGDGYEDPLFLWDADTRILSLRLFILARGLPDRPILRSIEARIFLRNAFDEVSE
jgi:type II secretory pathway pseudopilin PulG